MVSCCLLMLMKQKQIEKGLMCSKQSRLSQLQCLCLLQSELYCSDQLLSLSSFQHQLLRLRLRLLLLLSLLPLLAPCLSSSFSSLSSQLSSRVLASESLPDHQRHADTKLQPVDSG